MGREPEPPTAAADRAAAGRLVEALTRLRAEGAVGRRTPCWAEAAHGPASRCSPRGRNRPDSAPTTLLWETSSLPAESLVAEGRRREGRALLDACVRARTPEEAARSVEPAPPVLVPLLLAAVHEVSDERHWDQGVSFGSFRSRAGRRSSEPA
ncbi:hypothetical protein [Streptomyces sp. NPDC058812]|uniref:hypothetical protein n=1 Tax=unclassified Streptomyces TaxID=2593676 RepID=UPI0036BE80F3